MSQELLISTNPADGYSEVGRIQTSSETEIERAVRAAHLALPAWRALSVQERGTFLGKFRELLKGHLEQVAKLQTQEMGKPIAQSIGECKAILSWLKWNLENAPRILAPRLLDKDVTF